jgi:hypothetical protein
MQWNGNECEKNKVMIISKEPSSLQIMIFQKQLENLKYFNCFGSITNDARCTREIKSRIAVAKASLNRKTTLIPANWT